MELSRSALQCCVLWQTFEPFALGCCYDSELQIAFSCAFGRFLLTHDIQQPVSRTGVHMLPLRIVLKLSVIRLTAINAYKHLRYFKPTYMTLKMHPHDSIVFKCYKQNQAVAARWAATAWFSRLRHSTCSASGQSQLHAWAAASQPAGWYRPTAYGPTNDHCLTAWGHRSKSVGLHARIFGKMSISFVSTTHRHKTQHMSCTWSARVCVHFRHRMTRRSGGDSPQIKQTLKYLVDITLQ